MRTLASLLAVLLACSSRESAPPPEAQAAAAPSASAGASGSASASAPGNELTVELRADWQSGTFVVDVKHTYGKPGQVKLFLGTSDAISCPADAQHALCEGSLAKIEGRAYMIEFLGDDNGGYATATVEFPSTPDMTLVPIGGDAPIPAEWMPRSPERKQTEVRVGRDGRLTLRVRGAAGDTVVFGGRETTLTGEEQDLDADLLPFLRGSFQPRFELPLEVRTTSGPSARAPLVLSGSAVLWELFWASKGKGITFPGEPAATMHVVLGDDGSMIGKPATWADVDRVFTSKTTYQSASPCRYTVVSEGPDQGKSFTVNRETATQELTLYDRRTGRVIRQQKLRGKLAPCPRERTERITGSSTTDTTFDLAAYDAFKAALTE